MNEEEKTERFVSVSESWLGELRTKADRCDYAQGYSNGYVDAINAIASHIVCILEARYPS